MNSTIDLGLQFISRLGGDLARKDFDLPAFPETALRVRQLLKEPNISLDKLSNVVLSEPALTARLLRMANSALMRRGTIEITDVKTAISRLGFNIVETAAVSLAANQVFQVAGGSAVRQRLDAVRKHSVRVSAIAYVLAARARTSTKPDTAMLAGLLHAIGKFYILTKVNEFPDLFANTAELNELLEHWHAGVGKVIVEHWGFPEEVVEAVDEHQLLDREKIGPPDLTDIIIVANVLADVDDPDTGDLSALDDLPSLERLKMDAGAARTLLQESTEQIQSLVQALTG